MKRDPYRGLSEEKNNKREYPRNLWWNTSKESKQKNKRTWQTTQKISLK